MTDFAVTGHARDTSSFGMPQRACVFSANVVTKLDHGKCSPEKRPLMFKIPDHEDYHTDVNEYHRKVEAIFDKIGSFPVAQEHLVEHTIRFQTQHMEGPTNHLDFPEAEKTVPVAMLETDNWNSMNAILGHPALKTTLEEAREDFGLHEDSHCFTDVQNLVYNYDKNQS
ncbi:hypothetical protein C8F01DRAFT_479900 [Mycena amicta]|nr:hypothetical protein C8F01DRAFT_479900 [Mycena amicta]